MFRNVLVVAAAVALLAGGCSQSPPAVKHSPTAINHGPTAMNTPTGGDPWVIRTDFASDGKWKRVCDLIAAPQREFGQEFFAYVRYVDDPPYRDQSPLEIVRSLPDDYPGFFCFVVDRQCIENPEHPVFVVGFYPSDHKSFDRKPRDTPQGDVLTFRALPSQIQAIQNNLSIANMDYEDFANSVGDDGVFRGFSR